MAVLPVSTAGSSPSFSLKNCLARSRSDAGSAVWMVASRSGLVSISYQPPRTCVDGAKLSPSARERLGEPCRKGGADSAPARQRRIDVVQTVGDAPDQVGVGRGILCGCSDA